MKNRRRILKNRRTGKSFSAKSDDAVKYMQDFVLQVPANLRKLQLGKRKRPLQWLRSSVHIYYPSMRSDLDTAIIYDCLQEAGVIVNDRYIREHHEWAHIDAVNPRCEITLEEI